MRRPELVSGLCRVQREREVLQGQRGLRALPPAQLHRHLRRRAGDIQLHVPTYEGAHSVGSKTASYMYVLYIHTYIHMQRIQLCTYSTTF